MNSFEFSTNVHANRDYNANEVRHYKQFPEIKTSLSGLFGSANFPELLKRINSVAGEIQKIYFVDTISNTHFELNEMPVSYKNDNNLHLSPNEIIEREKMAAAFLKGKSVTFTPNVRHGGSWEEFVENSSTVQDFILSTQANVKPLYFRLALDEHGPLTDAQVETFMSLLSEIKGENNWLHINSIVGGGPAKTLLIMEDILLNGSTQSLESIAEKYDIKFILPAQNTDLKEPTQEKVDPNAEKKAERAKFLIEFYQFATTRQPDQTWTAWKSQK